MGFSTDDIYRYRAINASFAHRRFGGTDYRKSGVLNLGVEGMMLVGAVFAFIVAFITDSFWLGATAGIGAGIVMAALFALLTVFLRANQVACGLALTIFGAGFSAFVGLEYEGKSLTSPPAYKIPFLGDIPVLGPCYLTIKCRCILPCCYCR